MVTVTGWGVDLMYTSTVFPAFQSLSLGPFASGSATGPKNPRPRFPLPRVTLIGSWWNHWNKNEIFGLLRVAKQVWCNIGHVGEFKLSSWWLNQPIWKICSSNWKSSPSRGEKKMKPPPSYSIPNCCINKQNMNKTTGNITTSTKTAGWPSKEHLPFSQATNPPVFQSVFTRGWLFTRNFLKGLTRLPIHFSGEVMFIPKSEGVSCSFWKL